MKTIRSNVFETNSSSVHTVCLDRSHSNKISGVLDKDSDGAAVVHLYHEFGWSGSCAMPDEKLAYLCLIIHYTANSAPGSFWWVDKKKDFDAAADFVENSQEFQRLKEIVCTYFPYSGLKIDRDDWQNGGYIDHQAIETYSNLEEWLTCHGLETDYDIYNFIFGKSQIIIDNDNH